MNILTFVVLVFVPTLCLCANMTLYTLSSHPYGSSCLDGSPYAYYYRPGNSTTKWVIHHQGGGWCNSLEDCYERSSTILGSSTQWAPSIETWVGILDDDPAYNPNYYTWNAVILFYCDGTSFSGDRMDPVTYNGKNIHVRGYSNLLAASNNLLDVRGLDNATDVIITGCSAGGLSTYIHTDYWKSAIVARSPNAHVVGVADAGWFLNANDFSGQISPYTLVMQGGIDFWNSTAGFHQGCVNAYLKTNETWKCAFAEYIYPFIETPILAVNSKNDNWQIYNILRLPCSQNLSSCNSTEWSSFHDYSDYYLSVIAPVFASPKDGAFISSCYTHCQTIDDEAWTKAFLTSLNGTKVSPSMIVTSWYNDQANTKAVDKCEYPCNPTCQSY